MSGDIFQGNAGGAAAMQPSKFSDPFVTAAGQPRARVSLEQLDTLWFNTGTLCNIECANCYIFSGPKNDRLAYISAAETVGFLDEIYGLNLEVREIGFTGGEPFMNPEIIPMLGEALARGFEVLVLTNAMKPMQRPKIRQGLEELRRAYGDKLTLRVSLDHYTSRFHELERGEDSWASVIAGLDWLSSKNFKLNIAGRTCWNETGAAAREGYARLFKERNYDIDAAHPGELVLFPEMDEMADVPEITTSCFAILGKSSKDLMCASSRMIVKPKATGKPVVQPCTLLPYDEQFEMGNSLAQSLSITSGAIDEGDIMLNHCHCAKFCMLGGGSCSV